jgi:phosphatidylcholine synthase
VRASGTRRYAFEHIGCHCCVAGSKCAVPARLGRIVSQMRTTIGAYSVHLLTATGAVFSMCALVAAASGNWPVMFSWLLAALLVDGIDGPLSRKLEVRRNAPVFDGVILDLVVDYLSYVLVPAFALFASGMLPEPLAWLAAALICFGSALYFADTRMKTTDYSFRGFPACWNMVVLGLFVVRPEAELTIIVIVLLAVAMFLPIRFVHPVRTVRWRPLTLAVTAIWAATAVYACLTSFTHHPIATWVLVIASCYLLCAGGMQQLLDRRADEPVPAAVE